MMKKIILPLIILLLGSAPALAYHATVVVEIHNDTDAPITINGPTATMEVNPHSYLRAPDLTFTAWFLHPTTYQGAFRIDINELDSPSNCIIDYRAQTTYIVGVDLRSFAADSSNKANCEVMYGHGDDNGNLMITVK